jgi:hypothetical protein
MIKKIYDWGYDSIVVQNEKEIIINKIIHSGHVAQLYLSENETWSIEKGHFRIFTKNFEKFESSEVKLILEKNKKYNVQNISCSQSIIEVVKLL